MGLGGKVLVVMQGTAARLGGAEGLVASDNTFVLASVGTAGTLLDGATTASATFAGSRVVGGHSSGLA